MNRLGLCGPSIGPSRSFKCEKVVAVADPVQAGGVDYGCALAPEGLLPFLNRSKLE